MDQKGGGLTVMGTRLPYIRPSIQQPTSPDIEAIKRNGFHDSGVLVVKLDDHRLNWADRELLKGIGERLYGKPRFSAG